GPRLALGAEVRPGLDGARLRLDADPRHPPPQGGRSRLRPLRPRRLAGAAGGCPRHARRPGVGDARLRRRPGPLPARAGPRRPAGADALRGRAPGGGRGGGADVKAFADLYAELDATTGTLAKVRALARYFASAEPADAAWAVYFLSGRRPRQAVPTRK